jgi:hypothetical protein
VSTRGRRTATYPDFLCIGAQKAGTTWLYQNLRAHPELWLPPEKEIHYFDRWFDYKPGLYAKLFGKKQQDEAWRWRFRMRWNENRRRRDRGLKNLSWELRYLFGRPDDQWYSALFERGRGKLKGELSPGYAVVPPERVKYIHRLMPDAKLFFMLRNPVERAWSGAIMTIVRRQSLEASRDLLVEHFESEGSRSRTNYLRTLEVWGAEFPPEQIFIGFLEDITFRPHELIERVHQFLGVAPREQPQLRQRKVFRGVRETIPLAMAVYLARLHRDAIAELARRFGGHASWWAYVAERLLEEPEPESWEEVPYPFWKQAYWSDWIDLNGFGEGEGEDWLPPLQSGVLSELDRTLQPR